MVCIILCSLYMIYVYDYVMFCHFDRVSDVLLRMLYDYRIDMSYHMLYIVMLIIVQSNVILCCCITFDFRIRTEGCKSHISYRFVRPSGQ